jgi:colicin import membrane protein
VYRGLLTSFVGHALLLFYALFDIHAAPPDLPPIIPIEATIITPSELTRLKQGDPTSKQMEAKAKEEPPTEVSKKEAEKPKPITAPPPAAEPPPPEPEPQKTETPPEPKKDPIAEKLAAAPPEPTPEPGPTPEEKKKLEEKLEQEKKAEEKKKADEKKKAEDKKKAEEKKKADEKKKKLAEAKRKADEKKKFDADKIAALLDKTPDKRGAPQSSTPPTKPTDYTGPTAGERQGNDTVLSAREQDLLLSMINSQLEPCARLPGGGGGPDTPIVNVRFRLNQDGSLNGEPVIVDRQNTPLFAIAADASVRAIKQCAPFQLPPDKYSSWSDVTWAFDWPVILGLVQR